MSHRMIVKAALKRREVFRSLDRHLQTIKETITGVDPHAESYLFGSVAENRHLYSSDIDVLIVTKAEPAIVYFELWKAGIKEPFEIHVQPPEKTGPYKRRAKLVEI
jgi:predicted nucleotidyltransferase